MTDEIEQLQGEIESLRKMVKDWKETAEMLAIDLGKIEYAAAVYEDVQSGLYKKVRERMKKSTTSEGYENNE